MTERTLHITVESTAEFFDAAASDLRAIATGEDLADRYVVSLPDEAALARLLSATTLELLRAIANESPESIRALARTVDRDVKNVSTALQELEALGLVEFEQDGQAKRPTIWYDDIEIAVDLQPAESGEEPTPV
jgi:predicted transcriptional regulator